MRRSFSRRGMYTRKRSNSGDAKFQKIPQKLIQTKKTPKKKRQHQLLMFHKMKSISFKDRNFET